MNERLWLSCIYNSVVFRNKKNLLLLLLIMVLERVAHPHHQVNRMKVEMIMVLEMVLMRLEQTMMMICLM